MNLELALYVSLSRHNTVEVSLKMEVNDSAEDRARTSTFSAVSHPYNAASTLAPSQRDLRIQAARRNLAEHQEQHHQQQVGATIAADNDDTTTTGTSTTDEDNARPDNANARQRTKKPDLHRIVTETGHGRPSAHTGNTHAASKNASDAIFAQLQVIQTLQVGQRVSPVTFWYSTVERI